MRWIPLVALLTAMPSVSALAQEPDDDSPHIARHVFRWKGAGSGYLGVDLLPMSPELRTHFGAPEDAGVLVSRVSEDGPAALAGIQVGDVLTAIDGESVGSIQALARGIRNKEEGESVTIELYRNGGLESYPVTIAERDRKVFDFSSGFAFIPEMPDIEHDIVIAGDGPLLDERAREAMEEAMRELGERLESEEWTEKLERLQELDFSSIQERMREVESRLRELESELEKRERL